MAIDKVRAHLKKFGVDDQIKEFDVSSATVDEAASAIGVEGKRIAKSLSFLINDRAIIIVVAGDAKIDNKKYKAKFSAKAKMIAFDDVERITGHGVGGVCPFGVNKGVDIYFDDSLKRFETVFPACGSTNSAIELTLAQLEEYVDYIEWVDVCKISEE